ncbi:MAG: hypothetical protein ACRYFZ_15450 [Janthinobacterium lividum]
MRKWPLALVLTLTVVGSVAGYFALQVLAAFVAFFIYGSGDTGAAKWANSSVLFVVGQVAIVSWLFYRKRWLKSIPALALALLIPVGLFLAL